MLEARERVGGRLLNATLGEGVTVDVGGQWVGGRTRGCRGLPPSWASRCSPSSAVEEPARRRRDTTTLPGDDPAPQPSRPLGHLSRPPPLRPAGRRVSAAEPWAAERAAELDRPTLAAWVEENVRTPIARELLGLAGRTIWGTGPAELSMLHVLFYVNSAGGFDTA